MRDDLSGRSTMGYGAGPVGLARGDVVENVLHCFTMG
jgi:hypothetical protein